MLDSILVLQNYVVKPFIVYGGGSLEAVYKQNKESCRCNCWETATCTGKIAIKLEKEIPLTIARNAGMDELNTITELRAKISKQTDAKIGWYGINAIERKVDDMRSRWSWNLHGVKEQVLKTAVEVTSLLIRVDDVLIKASVEHPHSLRWHYTFTFRRQ